MNRRTRLRGYLAAAVASLLVLGASGSASAQQPDDPEARAKRLRQGAGLRGGAWWVQDLREVDGAEYSQLPAFDGYFQKGLDLHLALESTLGLWRRSQEIEQTGVGGTTREEVHSYIVPLFTALKIYPFTRPTERVEPFLLGGIGFALGIDDRDTSGGNLLGLNTGSGTVLVTGFGFRLGAGAEWRFGRAFGLSVGGRYQWLRFGESLGGERSYKGLGLDAGLTYRFQYE